MLTKCPHCGKVLPSRKTARFLGWQEIPPGVKFEPFALFEVFNEGGVKGTTVGAETLKSLGIPIPEHPSLGSWRKRERIIND